MTDDVFAAIDAEDIAPSTEKRTDTLVTELFRAFSSDETLKKLQGSGRGLTRLKPARIDGFRDPSNVLPEITDTSFNAWCTIYAGHVYERPSGVMPDEERSKIAERNAKKIEARLNEILDSSDNPRFSCLKAEVVNKEYPVWRTYADPYDDGDDWFGVPLFVKFTFKKRR